MASGLLKPREVAEMLGVSRQAVYSWIASGELPSVRVGQRAIRVDRDDLTLFLVASSRAKDASLRGS
jgi:excisionase family DNA binding protein